MYKIKHNPDRSIARHKAKLVAKRFYQIAGIDYTETFSLVVMLATIKVLLCLTVTYSWDIK